jgi:hypothetical protein
MANRNYLETRQTSCNERKEEKEENEREGWRREGGSIYATTWRNFECSVLSL